MTVRFFITPLQLHVLLTCILITAPLKEDLSPRLVILKATRLENNEIDFYELNCSSSKQSIGNSAEFIVNGLTVEHISIKDNKCYNRKMEECITDHCQCFPRNNLYIYRFKMKVLTTEIILSCQMRFADNKTSNIIKAVISIRFNGTVSDVYEYDAKVLKHDNEKNEDKNENNSATDHISRWVPALCGVLLVISAVLILVYYRRRDENQPGSESFPLVKTGIFKRPLTDIYTIEGQQSILEFELERPCLGNTVSWFKNGCMLRVPMSGRFELAVLNDTIYKLTIQKTTHDDSGLYSVETQGVAITATLVVEDFFKRPLENIQIEEGEDVRFECEGEKKCSANWYKDGTILQGSRYDTTQSTNNVHRLTIKRARVCDTGIYMIEMHGIASTASLVVKGFFKSLLEDMSTIEGQEVSFECELERQSLVGVVEWFKDDCKLEISQRFRIEVLDDTIHKLTILEATVQDTGTYRVQKQHLQSTATLFVNARAKNIEIPDHLTTNKQSFARVMIVGKQSVGKTCLLRRLLCENIENICSTNGVDIFADRCKIEIDSGKWIIDKNSSDDNVHTTQGESMQFKSTTTSPSGPCALLSFCDFAGQKTFYATHQAFLTSCAIYILVADMNDDISVQGDRQFFADFQDVGEYVDFWINSIHCLETPEEKCDKPVIDPPIIIVFTGLDKIKKEDVYDRKMELQRQLNNVIVNQRKLRHLRRIFWLSNKNNSVDEFDSLRFEISRTASSMKMWDQDVPEEWKILNILINEIKKNGTHFITLSDMKLKAANPDKDDNRDQTVLLFLRIQHELGNIIFFEDIQGLIILNPQWLADAFRCIVSDTFDYTVLRMTDYSMYVESGKISESLIRELLASPKFSEQIEYVVKVMEKFDILVKIDISSDYIVPSMMPSVSFEEIYDMIVVKHISCKTTSWLCLKFSFIPPAFFNHICVWFMRRYTPFKMNSGVSMALFRGLCIFDINKTRIEKLLVTMSSDTIALQLLSFSPRGKELGSLCINIRKDLIRKIEDIKQRYRSKIRYDLHFKCSTGHYYKDTMSYTDLNRSAEYFCAEHMLTHQTKHVLLPWMMDYYEETPLTDEVKDIIEKDVHGSDLF